jgi:hypothetical protein
MSTDFTVEISQNEYLAEGAEDVDAIVTVTSPGTVQLKKRVDDADEMALDTRSTKTVRTKK